MLICFVLLIQFEISYAQDKFEITGKFRIEGGSNTDAEIIIESGGKVIQRVRGDAKFAFNLDYQKDYIVSFSKPGYVTKRLRFDTKVPADRVADGFLPFDFTIEIFPQMDDVSLIVFNQPVGVIGYDEVIDEFGYDTDYTKSIQARLDQAMEEVADKKEEALAAQAEEAKQAAAANAQVTSLTSAGDKSATSGNLDQALKSYEEAQKLKDSPEIQKKIADTKKLIADKQQAQAKQDQTTKLLADAQAAAAQGDLEGAKKLLTQAAALMEGDVKVKAELDKVNQQLTQKAQADQKFAELSKAAQDAAKAGNWAEAQKKADEALKLKADPALEKIKTDAVAAVQAEAAQKKAEAEKQAEYDRILAEAQKSETAKNVSQAIAQLESAQKLKDSPELQKRIADLKKSEADAAAAEKLAAEKKAKGEELLAQAQAALAKGDLATAKAKATEASGVLNDDRVAGFLKEVSIAEKTEAEKVAKEQETLAQYNKLVADGNTALTSDDLVKAKENFDKAKALKPDGKEADAGLTSVETKQKAKDAEVAKAAAAEAAKKASFEDLLANAQKDLSGGNPEEAKSKFQQAGALYPDKRVDKGIADAEIAIKAKTEAEAKEKLLNESVSALIAAGDASMASRNAEEAEKKYREAIALKNDPTITKKIDEAVALKAKIAEEKKAELELAAKAKADAEKKAKVEALVADGDKSLASANFDEAVKKYNEALAIADDVAIKAKVDQAKKAKLDKEAAEAAQLKIKAEQEAQAAAAKAEAEKKAKADALVSEGDKAITAGNFEEAIKKYNEALAFSDDASIKGKIDQANKAKDDKVAQAAAQEKLKAEQLAQAALAKAEAEKKAKADALVSEGDKAIAAGNFEEAIKKYNEALTFSDDASIKGKIDQANKAKDDKVAQAAAQEKLKAEQLALAAQAKAEAEKKAKADALVSEGDKALAAANFDESIKKYTEALAILNDPTIQSKLDNANNKKAEKENDSAAQAKLKEEQAARAATEKAFSDKVSAGDKALSLKKYDDAIAAYQQAIAIKSDDTVNQKIEDAKSQKSLAEKSLQDAEKSKSEAAQKLQAESEAKAAQLKYDNLVKEADKALASKDLNLAESKYTEASELKSNEAYPKDKIKEIKAIREKEMSAAELAAKEAAVKLEKSQADAKIQELEEKYASFIAAADKDFSKGSLEGAESGYREAIKLKSNDPYATKKLDEIAKKRQDQIDSEKALSEQQKGELEKAKAAEIEKNFRAAVAEGDQLIASKKLEDAIEKYDLALSIKDDQSVKDKIAKANEAISQKVKQAEQAKEAAQTITEERGKANEEIQSIILEEEKKSPTVAEIKSPEVKADIDQQPAKKPIPGGAVVISEPKYGAAAMNSPTARLSEDEKYDSIMKRVEDQQREGQIQEEQRVLKEKYPQRKTVESEIVGTSTVTKVFMNRGEFVNVYRKVEHNWGGVYYFIDERPTNQRFWEHETE